MTDYPRLLADVGGTNVRFALQHGPAQFGDVTALKVADFPSLEDAMRHYLSQLPGPAPRHAAIGLANPVTGDHVKLTNHAWAFSIEGMRQSLGLRTLLALNDFTSLALALPYLRTDELAPLREGQAIHGAPLALLGPGTGLGVSGLVPGRGGAAPIALAGEGGHIELMPQTDDEWLAWRAARREHGRVSAERLLSGAGLTCIHAALLAEMGTQADTPTSARLSPAEVAEGAVRGGDPVCRRAFEAFCGLLGSMAGNLALVLGARGGVYIGGGIVPRYVDAVRASSFAQRFVDKGRMREYLEPVPVHVITASHPALPGLAHALHEAIGDA
ncbi:glucokinase [Cupriavidus sp. AU9028]|uniref:glucokinase n=1 Tax=Cupriavidus sp. AU9028 TaxID=2871157 RepID=UPI001C97EC69|nr:glucokinase [Cupriavidus sp. AU9028]MBY4896887.1 glucokinase [Cupriavidus sp. AU9028]